MGNKGESSLRDNSSNNLNKERQIIFQARQKGKFATFLAFTRLSGPGWLQSATTLGGGSLSSSLYLGVLVGTSLLWLQPFAMLLGIIMLSGIMYVTLSTKQRPFRAINEHVNPMLGWSWLIATMMANLVWSMPQFALATAALQQNLFKSFLGTESIPDPWGKIIIGSMVLTICITVVMFYNHGGWGIKIFEIIIKFMVAGIVLSFIGVVVKMSLEGALEGRKILSGLIPNLRLLTSPAETFTPFVNAVDVRYQSFWTNLIVSQQRDVMISGVSAAVGINMTFLLPYSLLRKGWDRDFRGLAIFDLSTGLFIPFVLATGCVVIASATQFHTVPAQGFLEENQLQEQYVPPASNLVGPYHDLLSSRIQYEMDEEIYTQLSASDISEMIKELPDADKTMAAMLVKRDAFNLADALAPLTGTVYSQYVFGFGVMAMAISSIILLMLINGFVICEMINVSSTSSAYRVGCLMVSIGVLGPFFWNDAKLWLAIPTSVFGMMLLPIAYFTFCLMMNQKSLLGEDMPRGNKRVAWNGLMIIAACFAALGSLWSLWSTLHWLGLALFLAFIVLVLFVHIRYPRRKTR